MLEDACKEMGLSDEAAEQITTAYGKQAEEKINKVNSMVEFVAKQVKIEREKFYQEWEALRQGIRQEKTAWK